MNRLRSKLVPALIAAGVVVAASLTSFAGAAYTPFSGEVQVTPSSYAVGVMSATRASADTTAYLQCQVVSETGGDSAYCSARDAAGDFVGCFTSQPKQVATILAIQPDSRVYLWVSAGVCTQIRVDHDSRRM